MKPSLGNSIPFEKTAAVKLLVVLMFFLSTNAILGQAGKVAVVSDASGITLQVDGKDFMVNGMNWDYFPIGTNYAYSLWNQPDDIIKAALDSEMALLKSMGVNAIRVYTGIQPRWVQYIYENYGIYTMLNHSFGRYGVTLNGAYIANTEYSDPAVRALLLSEVEAVVREFKGVPGLLMYLLGNEEFIDQSGRIIEAHPLVLPTSFDGQCRGDMRLAQARIADKNHRFGLAEVVALGQLEHFLLVQAGQCAEVKVGQLFDDRQLRLFEPPLARVRFALVDFLCGQCP